jgi:hypothetical protein
MQMKGQGQRDAEMSTTLRPDDSYHRGLRILARMIARRYLEEKQAQYSKKERHQGADLIPEGGNNESRQENDELGSGNNRH